MKNKIQKFGNFNTLTVNDHLMIILFASIELIEICLFKKYNQFH